MELSTLSNSSQGGSVKLYFVLHQNKNPENSTKLLKYAFQASREHGLEPIWLSTEDCVRMVPTKQDVFVCDPFEGEAYEFLMAGNLKCVRVLGPRCLLTCLHTKKPVPEYPPPLHNMAMHGIVITSTGYDQEERSELQQLVRKMCGIFSSDFHEGVTHLLVKTVGTNKYLAAIKNEIPVMTEEWVKAVWKASNQESEENVSAVQDKFAKFACPSFRGLMICLSQLPRAEKESLREIIQANGGLYMANLEMATTSVLVTSTSEGDKYKHAEKWRIPCVTTEWINDSVECGHALPWNAYTVQKMAKASTPSNAHTTKGPPDLSICSTIMNETTSNAVDVDETVDQDCSLFLRKATDPRIIAGNAALENLDLQKVGKAGLFLDGCKIFASGFQSSMNEKLRKIVNAGGATRFNNLTEAVTHVVIGKVIDEHMNTFQTFTVQPKIVTADWLVECINEGRLVDEENFSFFQLESSHKTTCPPPPTSDRGASKSAVKQIEETTNATLIDVDLMNQYLNEKGKMAQKTPSIDRNMDMSSLPDSQETTNGGIFKGKVFTISGYSDEIEEQLEEMVYIHGGQVAEANAARTIDFCIVSLEGNGAYHPKALHYVTHTYLEDCLEQESLLPVQYYHMPFVWPPHLCPLTGCVIAVSVYMGKERAYIAHVSITLGALHQDMFARKENAAKGVQSSTHLLCPSPEGSKYIAAQKWGIPAVTKDWVFKCAKIGFKVLEDSFRVESHPREEVDCRGVIISLLEKAGKLPANCLLLSEKEGDNSVIVATPMEKKLRVIKNQDSVERISIQTPDTETIRRMYPTPNVRGADDSLDNMPTPETPYGSTWFPNPSSRIRKGFKRALDALPDDKSAKRPFGSPETPDEVYCKRYTMKLKEIIANHPLPKPPSGQVLPIHAGEAEEQLTESEKREIGPVNDENQPDKPADHHGPLTGVVVFATRKIASCQQELYRVVGELGGDYRWTYDSTVTHLLHYGRMNDTNKEFRLAKESGKFVVAPDWVWMCRDEGKRIDEALFPHVHNPKMSLSLISIKSTQSKKKRGRPKGDIKDPKETSEKEREEGWTEEEETDGLPEGGEAENLNVSKEALTKQLEELENLASVTGGAPRRTPNTNARTRSLAGTEKVNTPTSSSAQHRAPANTESESQGTAITWDDPQEREARARLQVALVGDTQDILEQKNIEKKHGSSRDAPNSSTSSRSSEYVFTFSGMSETDREEYADIVNCLGGKVLDHKTFDASLTHVVASRLLRSEKQLAAIASGKWIVYRTFLDSSALAGHFVNEEEHEWGNDKAISLPPLQNDSIEEKFASAAHRWRLRWSETGRGPFHAMNVALFSTRERVATFTRLVEAGGGQTVSNIFIHFSHGVVCRKINDDLDEITHCFVEMSKTSKIDLALFAARRIPCIPPTYLSDVITTHPLPDEMESCIPEYKEIIQNMT